MVDTVNTEKIYEGVVFSIEKDTVVLDNGDTVYRDVVRHAEVVAILAIDDEGNVILCEEYRHPIGKRTLGLPAGHVDGGEEPMAAAVRELQEEIGYIPKEIKCIGGFWSSAGFTDEYVHLYYATNLEESKLDEDEDITVVKYPLDILMTMASLGVIECPKIIAALFSLCRMEIPE